MTIVPWSVAHPMPAPELPQEPNIPLAPRASAADLFEQNPLPTVHERLAQPGITIAELDSIPEEERVREAVRRVIQDGRAIHEVAKELHLSATSILAWKSKYSSFLQEQTFGESNPAAAADGATISTAEKSRFSDNWTKLLEVSHASKADFKQDPLLVFLQTSSGTSWLYDGEGKLERFSLLGILLIFMGLAAVIIFLTADKGELAPAQDFHVTESEHPEAAPRYDLDIDRAGLVVQKFLRADTYIARIPFLREQEKVAPLVREFYLTHSDQPITNATQKYGMVGHGLVSIAFETPEGATLFFNLVPDRNTYLIDWFTSSLYQTSHIEKLVATKPTTPTLLHVQIARDNYYNFQFTEDRYQCFSLRFPGLARDLVGYAPRGGPLDIELTLLTELEVTHAAVIEVCYPAHSSDARQVEIVKFISKDWLPF